jgi:LacI family transcriptional regulator
MDAESKTTLRKIADKTGITRMAVSLALRGKAGVSDATREKVLKAAEELGYEPDPEVARLMARIRANAPSNTKACLALLTSGTAADDWNLSVTERKYVEGVKSRAKEYGYRIEPFWINAPGMTAERLGNIIWSRGIDGLIVAPLQGRLSAKESRSIQFDFSRFSVVEISETVEEPDLNRAIHDQYTSMLRLLHELSSLNYRRIGLVLEEALDLRVNGKWTAAYLQYCFRQGKKQMPPPLILPAPDQSVFNQWFDQYHPDVIVSVDRFGLHLVENRGLKIPAEVGYASLDLDGDAPEHLTISGIDQNSSQVGAAAVDMLVAAMQRGQRGTPAYRLHTQVEGTWVLGKSTVRQPKASSKPV